MRQATLFPPSGEDDDRRPVIRVVESDSGARRLKGASDFVRSYPPASEIVIVGASREAVDDFVLEISRDLGASFGLHRFSFNQWAALLASAELARCGLAPASGVGTEAVAARAAFEAREQQRIPEFEPVSDFPGFPAALASTLGDLRLAEIDAEGIADRRADDQAELLRRFDEQLRTAGVADRCSLLLLAISGLQDPRFARLRRAPLVMLDVPIVSVVEQRLVHAACRSAAAMLATIPAGDGITRAALARCGKLERQPIEVSKDETGSLARLRCFLFSEEAPPVADADDQVRFFSAPGEARECIEIARQLLDESRRGVPFDEMAVLVRTPASYNALLETALNRAQIPAYFARGTQRPDPSGRAFLSLLACKAEGLSARRFAEYLSFGQLPALEDGQPPAAAERRWSAPTDENLGFAVVASIEPTSDEGDAEAPVDSEDSPTIAGTLRVPWKWEELLVEAAVIGGKDRWRRRVAGLENELKLKLDELTATAPASPACLSLQRELGNLGHLSRFALPVIDALDDFPAGALWGEWLGHLSELAPRVLRQPDRVLAILADLEPMAAVGPVGIDEVRVVLSGRLSNVEKSRPRSRYGRLFVATPDQARGRRFRVVFIPGLAERVFPQRPREDPLLLDSLRKALSAGLATQKQRGEQERLLLRLAVGAAEDRVVLSYPRVDVVEARPRVPSFYALDVARATRGSIPDFEQLEQEATREAGARLAWPAPPDPQRAVDAIEHDLAILGPLMHADATQDSQGRARYLLELNEHLGRSLRTRWARWRPGRWTPYDGIVRTTRATADFLASQRPSERSYSVTALQHYAACPYKFLLSAIYRLTPREDPEPMVQLDPLTRGSMFHRIQAETLRRLQSSDALPLKQEAIAEAQAQLDDVLDRVARKYRDDVAPPIERVWQDEIEGMRTDLRAWLRHMVRQPEWKPIHFEFAFGLPKSEEHDPASTSDPVTLDDGWLLRGVVDLIEQREDGKLRVTDHKTGLDRTTVGMIVGGGEALQPVVYSLAVEKIIGKPVDQARLFFCTARGGFSERVVPLGDLARLYGSRVLEAVDQGVREGILLPAPRAGACKWCDFRSVCGPFEESRARRKSPELIAELTDLRTLP